MTRTATVLIALIATAGMAHAAPTDFSPHQNSVISNSQSTATSSGSRLRLSAPGEIRISPNNDSR